jgi:hypothetical protein
MQQRIENVAKLLFDDGQHGEYDRAKAFAYLVNLPPEIDELVVLCMRIAEREWAFQSLWWEIANIVRAAFIGLPGLRETLFARFMECGGRLNHGRAERAFALGLVLGVLSSAENEYVKSEDVLACLPRIFLMEYKADTSVPREECIDGRYEERIVKAIKTLVGRRREMPSVIKGFLAPILVSKDAKCNPLTGLVVDKLAYAALGGFSPIEKAKAVFGSL